MAYNGSGGKRLCTGTDLDVERSNGNNYMAGEPRRKREPPARPNHILLYTIINPAYPITVVVVLTGASAGIGAVTAKLFATCGATLTLVGRDKTRLLEIAKMCEEARGKKPLWLIVDLTAKHSCEIVASKTIETFGRIDILVNCAGKIGVTSLFDTSMDSFDKLWAINLRVPYELTQKCLPHLVKTKGHIVNVFCAPIRARPGFLVLRMISDSLDRFTKSSAVELASEGVKMNAVRPGLSRTPNLKNVGGGEAGVSQSNNKSIIDPEEIARMILLVASDTFPNLNAASLVVDGGGWREFGFV